MSTSSLTEGKAQTRAFPSGSLQVWLLKLVVLGLIDALGIWAVAKSYAAGWWVAVAFLAVVLIALNVVYFQKGALPGAEGSPPTVAAPAPGGAALSGYATVTGKTWMATVTLRGPSGSTTSGVWTPSGKVGGCTITIGDTCTFSLKKLTSLTASVTYTHTNAAVPAPDPSYVTIYSPMG